MKKITVIKIEGDPYCAQIRDILDKLTFEYSKVEVEVVDARIQPESVEQFKGKYRHVPSIFMDGQKLYESHPGESFEDCLEGFRKAFKTAS